MGRSQKANRSETSQVRYRLEIHPDALDDIEKAAEWYDQRQLGLGNEFARDVLHAIDALPLNPLLYRLRHRRANVRWKLIDTFPYRVVYQITGDVITVFAVLHSVRQERHWRKRL